MKERKRSILLTNDDGIEADGLLRLAKEAIKFGEVWVVAPDGERSAASHSITLNRPLDVYPHEFGIPGVMAFTCSGTPGDCVRVGSLSVMPYPPNLVISGINFGYNTATDLQYSATVGAAFEASFQGYPAIALSEGRKRHEVTDAYLFRILEQLIDQKAEFGKIVNVNFPECSLEQCKGILYDRKVSESMLFQDGYDLVEKLPDGGKRYMVNGKYQEIAEPDTDLRAVLDGYISVGTVRNLS